MGNTTVPTKRELVRIYQKTYKNIYRNQKTSTGNVQEKCVWIGLNSSFFLNGLNMWLLHLNRAKIRRHFNFCVHLFEFGVIFISIENQMHRRGKTMELIEIWLSMCLALYLCVVFEIRNIQYFDVVYSVSLIFVVVFVIPGFWIG